MAWEEARKAGRGGAGQLSLPPPLTPHLRPPAGLLTLTSRIHPGASPSSLPVQATVSLVGGGGGGQGASAPASPPSVGSLASALRSYSSFCTQQVDGASSQLSSVSHVLG